MNENCEMVAKVTSDDISKHVDEYQYENMNAKSPCSMIASKLSSILAKKRGAKIDQRNQI